MDENPNYKKPGGNSPSTFFSVDLHALTDQLTDWPTDQPCLVCGPWSFKANNNFDDAPTQWVKIWKIMHPTHSACDRKGIEEDPPYRMYYLI
jgi:hypothetical protein